LDFTGDRNKIFITRTPDDPTDSRTRVAAQKTNAHIATIPTELMDDIKKYYEETRKRFPFSRQHEFIFVSEKSGEDHKAGDPLSLKIKTFHPHKLRHYWHKLFDEAIKDDKVPDSEKDKMRKEAMGWARNSQMGNYMIV